MCGGVYGGVSARPTNMRAQLCGMRVSQLFHCFTTLAFSIVVAGCCCSFSCCYLFFTLRSIHIIIVVAETRQSALRPERLREAVPEIYDYTPITGETGRSRQWLLRRLMSEPVRYDLSACACVRAGVDEPCMCVCARRELGSGARERVRCVGGGG